MRTLSILLVAALTTAACSSSSSGSSTTTDNGTTVPSDIGGSKASCPGTAGGTSDSQACIDCEVTHCKSELQSTFGTDPTRYGGACAAFYACICACAPSDNQCPVGCFGSADAACKAATQATGNCIQANCASACPAN